MVRGGGGHVGGSLEEGIQGEESQGEWSEQDAVQWDCGMDSAPSLVHLLHGV